MFLLLLLLRCREEKKKNEEKRRVFFFFSTSIIFSHFFFFLRCLCRTTERSEFFFSFRSLSLFPPFFSHRNHGGRRGSLRRGTAQGRVSLCFRWSLLARGQKRRKKRKTNGIEFFFALCRVVAMMMMILFFFFPLFPCCSAASFDVCARQASRGHVSLGRWRIRTVEECVWRDARATLSLSLFSLRDGSFSFFSFSLSLFFRQRGRVLRCFSILLLRVLFLSLPRFARAPRRGTRVDELSTQRAEERKSRREKSKKTKRRCSMLLAPFFFFFFRRDRFFSFFRGAPCSSPNHRRRHFFCFFFFFLTSLSLASCLSLFQKNLLTGRSLRSTAPPRPRRTSRRRSSSAKSRPTA